MGRPLLPQCATRKDLVLYVERLANTKMNTKTRSNKRQRDWERQYTGPSFIRDKEKDKDKYETRIFLAINAKIRQKTKTKPRATVDNAKTYLSEEQNLPKGVKRSKVIFPEQGIVKE